MAFEKLGNWIGKALSAEGGRPVAAPRKGTPALEQLISAFSTATQEVGSGRIQRPQILDFATINSLANSDPVTFAIRRARKDQIKLTEWDVVPNIDDILNELDEWKGVALLRLKDWLPQDIIVPKFFSIPKKVYHDGELTINEIMKARIDTSEKRVKINVLFDVLVKRVTDEAINRTIPIRKFLKNPADEYTGFIDMILRVVDDLMLYDAGVMVKNNNIAGDKLAELYHVPGQQIVLCRNLDRSIPQPPDPAYIWNNGAKDIAEYTKDELIYLVDNPQHYFYGLSPSEVSAYVITTSLYADKYNIDALKNSNIPPMIVNLGAKVRPESRRAFQQYWNQELGRNGAIHKVMFVSGSEKLDSIPLTLGTNKDMQLLEYLRWTISIKCAAFQISPQDIGFTQDLHRTTANVQYKITHDRGLRSLLGLVSDAMNKYVIPEFDKSGMVKFEWKGVGKSDQVEDANVDAIDLQNGIISRNDRRRARGLRARPGGEVILVPGPMGNMVPEESLEALQDAEEVAAQQQEQAVMEEEQAAVPAKGTAQGAGGAKNGKKPAPASSPAKQSPSNKKNGEKKKDSAKTSAKKKPEKTTKTKKTVISDIEKVLDDIRDEEGGDQIVKITFDQRGSRYIPDFMEMDKPLKPTTPKKEIKRAVVRGVGETLGGGMEISRKIEEAVDEDDDREVVKWVAILIGSVLAAKLGEKALMGAGRLAARGISGATGAFTNMLIRRFPVLGRVNRQLLQRAADKMLRYYRGPVGKSIMENGGIRKAVDSIDFEL